MGGAKSAKVINAATTLDGVSLLCALARIDVGCVLNSSTKVATGLSNFKLKNVTVYRVNNKGYVAPPLPLH
ncbi:MAG: hypothetical protein LUE99_18035 [Bacteroides sp.]|nr:hypothetical protein [Bacteroides sp.]